MGGILREIGNTITLPIVKGGQVAYDSNRKIKAIVTLALIIILCIPHTRHALSDGFGSTKSFLNNRVHAGLVGGTMGAIYMTIGRELVNRQKFIFAKQDEFQNPTLTMSGVTYEIIEKETVKKALCVPDDDNSDNSFGQDDDEFTGGTHLYNPPALKESFFRRVAKNEAFLTLTLPISAPLASMFHNKRNTAITIVAMIIIAASILGLTLGVANFQKNISQGFKIVAMFLKNPIHAGLVGSIAGVAYIAMGRELLIRKKFSINGNCIKIEGIEYLIQDKLTLESHSRSRGLSQTNEEGRLTLGREGAHPFDCDESGDDESFLELGDDGWFAQLDKR